MNITSAHKNMPPMRSFKKDGKRVKVIYSPKLARKYINELKEKEIVSLDFETTGLHPDGTASGAQVRLTSLSWNPEEALILDHWFCGSFASLADDLATATKYAVFNGKFETNFFDKFTEHWIRVVCYDIANMRKSVLGGGPLSLASMCQRDLKLTLDKEQQLSDWSKTDLTPQQYFYAGLDAIRTEELRIHWTAEMSEEHWAGFYVLNDCTRCVIQMEETGIKLDIAYHQGLCNMWKRRRDAAEKAIRKLVPTDKLANIRSKHQISKLLKEILDEESYDSWPRTGDGTKLTPSGKERQLALDRKQLTAMSYLAPYPLSRFLAALMVFNRADKYFGTYGEKLINKQLLAEDRRVHGRINIAQAITGRMSSSDPNMQNFPRAPVVRRSFITSYIRSLGQRGKLIVADYSGVEIRVLAELSGDEKLRYDCIYDDVHSRSAIALYNVDPDEFFQRLKAEDPKAKEMRSRAKGFTFQLLYGAGAAALAIVLRCGIDDAEMYIRRWAENYPRAYGYRQTMFDIMKSTGFLPCVSGRTIYVNRRDQDMPKAANYPIQGSAGDVMYRAMYHAERLLHKTYAKHQGAIKLVVTVHDELLFEAEPKWAESAKKILEKAMLLGWLDMFPNSDTNNLADAAICDNWAGKK